MRRMRFWVALLAVALLSRVPFVRNQFHRVHDILQSGTNAITGKDAVDIGQDIRREQLQNVLDRALKEYQAMNGEAPRDMQDLVRSGLLQNADMKDEWGRPLVTETSAHGVIVRSLGADGQSGTEDDWTVGG